MKLFEKKTTKKRFIFFLMSRFSMISPLYNKRIGLNDGPSPIALYVLAIKDPKSAIASTGFFLIFLKTCKKN